MHLVTRHHCPQWHIQGCIYNKKGRVKILRLSMLAQNAWLWIPKKQTGLFNPAVYPIHWHIVHLNLLDVDTILCPVLCPLCAPCFPLSSCVCSVVAFQVALVHRWEHSFLLKSSVWSSEHTDCVQLTATTAGFSILAAQTTLLLLLLHGSWDNDRKAGRNHFLESDDIRSYEDSQKIFNVLFTGWPGWIHLILSYISQTSSACTLYRY